MRSRAADLLRSLRRNRRTINLGFLAGVTAITMGLGIAALSRARLEAPPQTLLLLDRHGRFLSELGGSDEAGYGYWPLESPPERVAAATLAAEDRRFWRHPGVDPLAVARAILQNLSSGQRASGASTLAMQIARMQRPGPRTYLRKAVEALTALALTGHYGREEILRHYLKIAPYGNQIHGVAYAARRYLAKPVADLSWAEVAFLAAVPQAPARMNPFRREGRARAVQRGKRILDRLHGQGTLSGPEHELAVAQIRTLRIPARGRRPASALHPILALEPIVLGARGRREVGPVVTTTLDLELQNEVARLTRRAVRSWEPRGAGNAAVAVLDCATREVLAWVGSSGYFDDRYAGSIDYSRVPRSAGSTLKPFLYALALERGTIGPDSVLDDLQRGPGGIGNSDRRFLGPLLPRVALANSRNVPAAHLLERVGLETVYAAFRDLGLHDGVVPPEHYGAGLAIGGLPATLEGMVRAYTALAGEGRLGDLIWYRGQPSLPPRRVFEEHTARQVTLMLADPQARLPTFPRGGNLEYPFPVAVKTGTSSNCHDAWAVAYSRRLLVAAWVGHPDYRPMRQLGGYRSAAGLVKRVLTRLHRDQSDGQEDVGFPTPRGFEPVRLCALAGGAATPACDHVFVEHIPGDRDPPAPCQAHVRRAVDTRNGLLATSLTPVRFLEVRTFVELDPRYAAWQTARGLPRPPADASPLGGATSRALNWSPSAAGTPRFDIARQTVQITAPAAGLKVLRDPESPAEQTTLALQAVVDPPSEQLVWYVNDEPYQMADYPYTTRWPLTPGEHTIQARLPFTDAVSAPVRVTVY